MFGLKHKTSNKKIIQRLFINLQYSQNGLKYKGTVKELMGTLLF